MSKTELGYSAINLFQNIKEQDNKKQITFKKNITVLLIKGLIDREKANLLESCLPFKTVIYFTTLKFQFGDVLEKFLFF